MDSNNKTALPQRKKIDLVVTPGTSSTNYHSSNHHQQDSVVRTSPITKTRLTSTDEEREGGPQFPLITSENEKNLNHLLNNNTNNHAATATGTPPSSARTKTSSTYKSGALPRGATVITSTRGNLSFFANTTNNNNPIASNAAVGTSNFKNNTSIISSIANNKNNNQNEDEVQQFSFVSSSTAINNNSISSKKSAGGGGGGGGGILSTKGDFQYRVTTKGRKTYIQKVSSSSYDPIVSHRTPMMIVSGNNNNNQNNDNETTSLLGGNNINNQQQYNTTSNNNNDQEEIIDPQHGAVLEITHSADEPIPGLSFFSIGDGYFLPPPQAVVPNRNEGDDDEANNTHHDNGDDDSEESKTKKNESNTSDYFSPIGSINDNSRGNINQSTNSAGGNINNNNNNGDNNGGDASSSSPASQSTMTNLRQIFSGSKNVPRMFIFNLLDGACFGLWQAAVLPNFMYIIGDNSNSFVGYNAAVQGGCQMTSALIAAYIGDKKIWPKRYLLRLASLVGCIAIAITVMAVYTRSSLYFWPSSALWGVYMGFSNPASESIFADSVPGGQRVAVYTYKWILQLLSYLFGYITTIVMFSKFGDSWALNEMTPVLYAGLFAHISSMISLWFLHDDFTLDVHKERNNVVISSGGKIKSTTAIKSSKSHGVPTLVSATIQSSNSAIVSNNNNSNNNVAIDECNHHQTGGAGGDCVKCIKKKQLIRCKITCCKDTTTADDAKNKKSYETSKCEITELDKDIIEELEDDAKREKTGDPYLRDICPSCCCCCGNSNDDDNDDQHEENNNTNTQQEQITNSGICAKMTLVPILIVMGDICQAIGGGVTVRFFPLFFKNDLDVTPVELAVVSIILCIFAALLSHFLKKFSSNFKRTTLIIIIRLLGSGLMFLLEFAEGAIGHKYPMLTYFVLRSALLNSMMGLSRSIIMDFCRKKHRTFFSAMESVSSLSFSGSAAIGGVVADAHGYRSTFGVTAGFYVVSALMVLPSGLYVDKNLKEKENEKKK